MSVPVLGRLVKVEVRDVWQDEARDFTPWLARPEHIAELSETLELDLEVLSIERGVGPFRADIVCRDTFDQSHVLIESQLERTNHVHLGQLLTYAAGLDAVTIVWIAERFADEHRAALDWLNEVTNDKISFFGIEIELWRIGDSMPAPKFNVVCRPNDWVKTTAAAAGSGESSELKQLRLEYWTALKRCLLDRNGRVQSRAPSEQNWTDFPTGRSGFWYSASIDSRLMRVTLQLALGTANAKTCFRVLESDKAAIESEFGGPLEWDMNEGKKSSQIRLRLSNADPADRADWDRQHAWLADNLENFNRVFRNRVRELPDIEGESDDVNE